MTDKGVIVVCWGEEDETKKTAPAQGKFYQSLIDSFIFYFYPLKKNIT